MKTTIRTQAIRLFAVYLLLGLLCIWQSHFIIMGIESNPYLNLLIIGVFIFGSTISVRTMYGLRNDVVAYDALQAVYNDAKQRGFEMPDRQTLLSICLSPGKVYKPSQLLGPVFDLTMDELLRSREMRVSLTTMQNLVGSIDSRVAHQRSLTNYLTGLCIFLGLIGTFIGLMEMVASVGGIIGGLASADGNSSEVMKTLIKNLEAPLTGMAQGFSASLFGLFGSLMLGLIARFTNIATHSIRESYESWLASISQIDSQANASMTGGAADVASNPLLQRIGLALRTNTERMEQQMEIVERISRQLDHVVRAEKQTLDGLAKIDAMQGEMSRMREDMSHSAHQQRTGMLDAFEQLARSSQEQHAVAMNEISTLALGQRQTVGALGQLAATQERLSEAMERRHTALQAGLAKLEETDTATQARLDDIAGGQTHILEQQARDRSAVLAALERLVEAQSQTQSALADFSGGQLQWAGGLQESQSALLTAIAQLSASQERTQDGLSGLGDRQARLEQSIAAQAQGQSADLARIASIQEHANALLIRLATAQAGQPSQATVTAIVSQSISASVSDIAQAMERSLQKLGHEMTRLADEQTRMIAASSASPEEVFKREMREMSRTLQNGIGAGLAEVAQTLESTLATYADVLRTIAERQPGDVAPRNSQSRSF